MRTTSPTFAATLQRPNGSILPLFTQLRVRLGFSEVGGGRGSGFR